MLDEVFELSEPEVIKHLTAILREIKKVHKDGSVLFIKVNPWNENINEKENAVLHEAIFTLFSCVSFMDTMRIFYK